MLNIFLLQKKTFEAFVSHGKVVTNKDGIIEIVGLAEVDNSVSFIASTETARVKALALGENSRDIVLGNTIRVITEGVTKNIY